MKKKEKWTQIRTEGKLSVTSVSSVAKNREEKNIERQNRFAGGR
jgi:hypothetical protein